MRQTHFQRQYTNRRKHFDRGGIGERSGIGVTGVTGGLSVIDSVAVPEKLYNLNAPLTIDSPLTIVGSGVGGTATPLEGSDWNGYANSPPMCDECKKLLFAGVIDACKNTNCPYKDNTGNGAGNGTGNGTSSGGGSGGGIGGGGIASNNTEKKESTFSKEKIFLILGGALVLYLIFKKK